ncbi:MAG TPA: hypothetical protein VJ978_09615 [Nitriliruptoraceae bacterium]|nr:hypothetical protein [Nitriliruptoraceae bacterium]
MRSDADPTTLDRRVTGQHVDAVRRWLPEQPWQAQFEFYVIGSVLDGSPVADLDLAVHPRGTAAPSWRVIDRVLRDVTAYGLVFHRIRIDPAYSPNSQDRLTQLAHDGKPYVVYALPHPAHDDRMRQGDTTVTEGELSLVRIERRLCEMRYYAKLPFGEWHGRRQRMLRPARLLLG